MSNTPHIPVLAREVEEIFKDRDGLFIDCTLGFGGHSEALLKANPVRKIIAIDKDDEAIEFATRRLESFGIYGVLDPQVLESGALFKPKASQSVTSIKECPSFFDKLAKTFQSQNLPCLNYSVSSNSTRSIISNFLASHKRVLIFKGAFSKVMQAIQNHAREGFNILADIGVSSHQLDSSRGFSFKGESIDMRMDLSQKTTAQDILMSYDESKLSKVFLEFGEIRGAKKLAREIIQRRKAGEDFSKAQALNSAISSAMGRSDGKLLSMVYQALRIETNGELDELRGLMSTIENLSNSRVCVITFHSLEDRIVKGAFKELSKSCICAKDAIKCTCGGKCAKGALINKKPLIASQNELAVNPRASCAKLRAIELF